MVILLLDFQMYLSNNMKRVPYLDCNQAFLGWFIFR